MSRQSPISNYIRVCKMKISNILSVFFVGFVSFNVSGCVEGTGRFNQSNETRVGLDGNNYKMVKAGVRGESTGFTLLGILPLVAPSYADAKANLYANTGENLTGRSIALANQTEDKSGINLLIFQVPKVTITADVVEFTEKSQRRPSSLDEKSQKP
jgi:hypothetical protein